MDCWLGTGVSPHAGISNITPIREAPRNTRGLTDPLTEFLSLRVCLLPATRHDRIVADSARFLPSWSSPAIGAVWQAGTYMPTYCAKRPDRMEAVACVPQECHEAPRDTSTE